MMSRHHHFGNFGAKSCLERMMLSGQHFFLRRGSIILGVSSIIQGVLPIILQKLSINRTLSDEKSLVFHYFFDSVDY